MYGILREGDKINGYFQESEEFMRQQSAPVLAAALKGMFVTAAHLRLTNSD
jgi:hypothetical protein